MGIHVTIGEAEKRLAELVAAALRGEEVVLGEEGARVTLVPAKAEREGIQRSQVEQERIGTKRRAAFGMWRDKFEGYDTSLEALKADRVDMDARLGRHLDAAD